MNSNNSYNKTSENEINATPLRVSKKIIVIIALISLLGFFDASYLAAKHYLGGPIPCAILDGCETVTTSKYSAVSGVPVALIGAVYYLIILVLAISYWESKKDNRLFLISVLTTAGFLASLWFVYLQVFVLKSLCLYCLFSAFASTALFTISATFLWRKFVKNSP